MTLFRAYLAISLDGYIADKDGGVGWLDPYFSPALGFDEFQQSIGATVLGRATFDQSLELGHPFAGERMIVLTHRSITDAPPGVETFGGDVSELAANLRNDLAAGNKDVWLMGGGLSIAPFCKADLVDRYELYIMPVLLGTGIPLFPPNLKTSTELRLVRTRELPKGIVETIYEPANRARPRLMPDETECL